MAKNTQIRGFLDDFASRLYRIRLLNIHHFRKILLHLRQEKLERIYGRQNIYKSSADRLGLVARDDDDRYRMRYVRRRICILY